MRRLHRAVERLLLRGEHGEVPLGGRCQRLQRHLQRIVVDPIPEVEQLHRDLGVGQEERRDVPLAQVLAHGVVVGEVAVVDQRLVQPDEGMGAARMPDPALGRVALMRDPDAGRDVLQPVVLHHLLGVAHDLEHDQVPPVAEHEGPLLAQTGVEGRVQLEGVLVDELILDRARRQLVQVVLVGEAGQRVRPGAGEVAPHLRRFDLQSGHVAPVVYRRHAVALHDVESAQALLLDLAPRLWIEVGDLDQVGLAQRLGRDAHLRRVEPGHRDAAALAVAPVVHLGRRLHHVAPGDRHVRGQPQHAAAALGRLGRARKPVCVFDQMTPRSQHTLDIIFFLH